MSVVAWYSNFFQQKINLTSFPDCFQSTFFQISGYIMPKISVEIISLNYHHNIVVLFCVALLVWHLVERVLQEKKDWLGKNDHRFSAAVRWLKILSAKWLVSSPWMTNGKIWFASSILKLVSSKKLSNWLWILKTFSDAVPTFLLTTLQPMMNAIHNQQRFGPWVSLRF